MENATEYAIDLKADLYYDLLDKYVALKADFGKVEVALKSANVLLSVYKEKSTIDPELIRQSHNNNIKNTISILRRSYNIPDAIHRLEELKIKLPPND